ncbi:hypothetical protein Slin15195_G021970 [Septoria linicola]|uniref:Uncharacterized protein n=1 Tax=Septoria linicola TaxID=215465 RepID=A0A9Q9AKY6_9PEZI|nr:hypothetical protein Slin14017_G130440 [Septoria linicola]USW48878.1 hypothetical protein Slin15195_G021970 [Septoria linicola]
MQRLWKWSMNNRKRAHRNCFSLPGTIWTVAKPSLRARKKNAFNCRRLRTKSSQMQNELRIRLQQLGDLKSELERKEVVISYLESRVSKSSTEVGSNDTARRISAPELRRSIIEDSEEDSGTVDIAPPRTEHQNGLPTSKTSWSEAASINGNGYAPENDSMDNGTDSVWHKICVRQRTQGPQSFMLASDVVPWMEPTFVNQL